MNVLEVLTNMLVQKQFEKSPFLFHEHVFLVITFRKFILYFLVMINLHDLGDRRFYIWTSFNSLVSKSRFCKIITGKCYLAVLVFNPKRFMQKNSMVIWHTKTILRMEKSSFGSVLSRGTILIGSSHQRCFTKKLFLKISQYSQENTCVERDSNTGVFL